MSRLTKAEGRYIGRQQRWEYIAKRANKILFGSFVAFAGSIAAAIAESQHTNFPEPLFNATRGGFLVSAVSVSASGILRAVAKDQANSNENKANEALHAEFNKIMSGDELSLFRSDFGDPPESSE